MTQEGLQRRERPARADAPKVLELERPAESTDLPEARDLEVVAPRKPRALRDLEEHLESAPPGVHIDLDGVSAPLRLGRRGFGLPESWFARAAIGAAAWAAVLVLLGIGLDVGAGIPFSRVLTSAWSLAFAITASLLWMFDSWNREAPLSLRRGKLVLGGSAVPLSEVHEVAFERRGAWIRRAGHVVVRSAGSARSWRLPFTSDEPRARWFAELVTLVARVRREPLGDEDDVPPALRALLDR